MPSFSRFDTVQFCRWVKQKKKEILQKLLMRDNLEERVQWSDAQNFIQTKHLRGISVIWVRVWLTSCRLVACSLGESPSVCCSPADSVRSCTAALHRLRRFHQHPSQTAPTPWRPHEGSWSCWKGETCSEDIFLWSCICSIGYLLQCIFNTTWTQVFRTHLKLFVIVHNGH